MQQCPTGPHVSQYLDSCSFTHMLFMLPVILWLVLQAIHRTPQKAHWMPSSFCFHNSQNHTHLLLFFFFFYLFLKSFFFPQIRPNSPLSLQNMWTPILQIVMPAVHALQCIANGVMLLYINPASFQCSWGVTLLSCYYTRGL